MSRKDTTKINHGTFSSDSIVQRSIDTIRPAPENERLYRPVTASDSEVLELAKSVRVHGIMEPLVITLDGFIVSGHRRHMAAKLAGLTEVPCRMENVRRTDAGFVGLLREYNRQRVKTRAEITREEVISANPEEAYRVLLNHRQQQSAIESADPIKITGRKHRSAISAAKRPFLDAIRQIITSLRKYWPLSVRQIHYQLLNSQPLTHASKPASAYRNTKEYYNSAVNLITRARLVGHIPWNAIDDETRSIDAWDVHQSIAPFVRVETDSFLKGYYRDLTQSQPNQIEIIGEKNTIKGIIRPLAAEYCIPLSICRGYSSLPPRKKMADRFRASGKDKLIVLVMSDFDPEGEDIAHSFARSMRDDFGIDAIVPVKVALTREQVDDMKLPPALKAKKGSSRHDKFVGRHGDDVYELEAVPPMELQRILRKTIDSVIDVDAFNREIDREKQDAAYLEAMRIVVQRRLEEVNFGAGSQ